MAATEEFIRNLYIQYNDKLKAYALSSLRDIYHAEDVVQDTFFEAMRKADLLMDHPNIGGWLMETLKFKICNLNKKLMRLQMRTTPIYSQWGQVKLIPIPTSKYRQIISIYQTAKEILKPCDYYLFWRITIDEAAYEEVAKELHISVSAAYKRMERIRKKLNDCF